MNNNTRLIRNILYALKREYGGSVVVYRRTTTEKDLKKGTEKSYYRLYPVRRAIILPAVASREEHPNVKGVWRSYFDYTKTHIIVDGRAIPINIEEGDVVQIADERFTVNTSEKAGDNRSWLLELEAVETYARIQNFDLLFKNDIHVIMEVVND